MILAIIVSTLLLLLVVASITINNKIVTRKNRIEQALGSIDVYLLKRFDLVPNLLALLKKYMAHEKELLLTVTELRGQTQKAGGIDEQVGASEKLNKVMAGLSINVEAYPDLKADTQFTQLQYTLTELEEQLSAARRAYNSGVVEYNIYTQQFPNNLIARLRGDKSYTVLETENNKRQNIDLNKL